VTIFLISSSLKAIQLDQELTFKEAGDFPAYHFVLLAEEVDNDYWQLVKKGAKEAEKYYDVYVEYKGPQRTNKKEHMKFIDMAIASNVDGIITQALSADEFTPLINTAIEKGIPVVTIDTDAPDSDRVAYIGTDNYYSGMLAGKALIEDTTGDVSVAIITGSLDSDHQQLRVQGFVDVIESVERIEVIAIEESNISRIEAEQKAYNLMKNNQEINAFFGSSALDGIGIVAAARKLNKDDLYIIAYDTLAETIELLEKEYIHAIVAQEPFEMGFQSIGIMMESISGQPKSVINHTNTKILRKDELTKAEHEILVNGDVE
jgi:ribose transport system substrate-binding protein